MGTGNGRVFRPEGPVLPAQVEGLGIGGDDERPFQGRKPIMGTGNGRVFRPEGPILLAQVEGLGIGVGPPGMGYFGLKGRFC